MTKTFLVAIFCLLVLSLHALAIAPGQVDTFQDGTEMNWQEGVPTPNPPTNVPNGGPMGMGDAYLRNISSGGFGSGAKMVMFNLVQWIGNYNAAGVTRLTADMANLGTNPLHMRLAIRGGPGSSTYGSTTAVDLPVDGGVWHAVTFDLTPATMTLIGGADPLSAVLGNITELRVLSAELNPSFMGDSVNAVLGMDNLRAVVTGPPTPTSVVSRKLHSGLPFDVNLPLTGTSGIECRSGGATNDYQIVLTFPSPVTFAGAVLTAGVGSVSNSSGSGTATVTVNLTGVTNAQRLTLALQGVNGAGDISIPTGILVGDTNGDGFVNSGDSLQTRNRSGQAADGANFRSDVNTDGFINSGDTTAVRSRAGTSLP